MSAIATIKNRFSSVTSVLLIRGDEEAHKLLIAWTIYGPSFKDSPMQKGENEATALVRLWEEVGPINFKRLGEISGLPETRAEKTFKRLASALLLWPDGTVAAHAWNVLIGEGNAYVRSLMPKTFPSEPKKENPNGRQRDDPKSQKRGGKVGDGKADVQTTRKSG